MTPTRRFVLTQLAALALAGCAQPPASVPLAAPAVRQALAPTGTLRVAVYPGSPTSLLRRAGQPDRGVTVEVGQELARQLGVAAELRVYPRVAEVVAALQRGEADVTITNATPERAALLDFTPPLLALELGVLVPAASALQSVTEIDRSGLRIGVSQGSSSEKALRARLQQAAVSTVPNLEAAREALGAGRLDAFATNKAILNELQDQAPGTRLLAGRWGLEHLALGTGKGRGEAAARWLQDFAAGPTVQGLVRAAADRAGLRGLAPPEAR